MAVEVALGTPLAESLSSIVQPKIVSLGWSSDDDTSLAEYILLMLVNGKTQDQIASELASDLLPDETEAGTLEFSQWLFDQVSALRNRDVQSSNTQSQSVTSQQPQPSMIQDASRDLTMEGDSGGTDAEIADAAGIPTGGTVPTGPKAMRGGRTGSRGGAGRVMGQINKAMDRSNESVLHRVRPQSGTERINTHGRAPPTGPKSAIPRSNRGALGRMSGAMANSALPTSPQSPMMNMTPQQHMQFMAMLEQQANMMAQLMPGMVSPAFNPDFRNGHTPSQAGKSLFDRVEPRQRGNKKQQQNGRAGPKSEPEDVDMDEGLGKSAPEPSSSIEVENSQDTSESGTNTVCHFNLKCTRRDCPYAHQSPAAPNGTTVDVSDICPFGVACKNFKCTGRHPSPAQKANFQAEEQCKFFPYCTNTKCTFKHPTMPMCRNGADCSNPGCKFTHLQTHCKFNPCLNPKCPYKHSEGQRGSYADKVWTADGENEQENNHVSERKFVTDEDGEEELIRPEAAGSQNTSQSVVQTELIT